MAATTVARMDIDDSEARRLIRHGEPAYRTAAMRSLNRTGSRTLVRTVRGTAHSLGLPVRVVRKRARQRNATRSRLETTVVIYVRPVNPVSHGAKQTRAGVSGLGRAWPRSFIPGFGGVQTRRRSRSTGRFEQSTGLLRVASSRPELRKVAFQREAGAARYPIEAIKIPVRPTAEPILKKVVERSFEEVMNVEFPRQLLFALQQAAKGRGF